MNITPTKIASALIYDVAKNMPLPSICRMLDLETAQVDHLILTHGSADEELAGLVIARGTSAAILRATLGLGVLSQATCLTMTRDCLSLDLGQGPHVIQALRHVLKVLTKTQCPQRHFLQILPLGRTMWRLEFKGRVVGFSRSYSAACMRAIELETMLLQAA